MSIDMSQFYQAFFEESEELLAQAEHLLLAIDLDSPDSEDLNAIFRAAHSIKGGAATFGMTDMAEITHVLENLLDKIRKNEMVMTADHVDVFLAAKDMLTSQLEGHRSGADVDRELQEEIKRKLKAFSEGQAAAGSAPSATSTVQAPATPVAATPVVVAEEAPKAAAPAATGQLKHYAVTIAKLNEKDVGNLQTELSLLGAVNATKQADGKVVFDVSTEDTAETIITICTFIVEPEDINITEEPADKNAKTKYYVVVAELESNDISNMQTELALLGRVEYIKLSNGHHQFAVDTEDTEADILSVCSFIVEPESVKISRHDAAEVAPAAPAQATQSAPIQPTVKVAVEEEGFGLFEPLPAVASAAEQKVETPAVEAKKAEASPAKKEAEKPAATNTENTSIRVGVEKVDQLVNLVGELVITQAMIEQRVGKLDPIANEDLVNSISQLTRNTRDLQEAVMSIRMMPMDYVFSRFPRMVRDLAAKLGKKVEFVTQGAATELDKGLIERIIDPLTHLVRNSIDHGIEIPAKRKAAGKNETGRLTLSASNRGGNIVIEVTDDGAGLDRERILGKARQNGLAVTESMTDNEIWQLIFAPGFSTAEVVTDVSGRGVGMDVVKRNVSAMGGVIDIKSSLGFGSTMSISLPLTLAILDGMSISLGNSVYVVPLNLIVETMQPRMQDIKTVTGEGLMIHVRGEYLPIIPLYALFNQDTEIMHPTEGVLLILEAEGKKAALFVDGLVGQQQVVIKSLETNFKKIQGVSGATIMGDGSVALILDVPAIIKMGQNNTQGAYQ